MGGNRRKRGKGQSKDPAQENRRAKTARTAESPADTEDATAASSITRSEVTRIEGTNNGRGGTVEDESLPGSEKTNSPPPLVECLTTSEKLAITELNDQELAERKAMQHAQLSMKINNATRVTIWKYAKYPNFNGVVGSKIKALMEMELGMKPDEINLKWSAVKAEINLALRSYRSYIVQQMKRSYYSKILPLVFQMTSNYLLLKLFFLRNCQDTGKRAA